MRFFLLTFLLVTVGGLPVNAQDTPSSPPPPKKIVADPFPPTEFTNLSVEKDDGNTVVIISLNGDAVIYQKLVDGKVVDNATAHPTGEDWFNFVQAINRAKVYKWAATYYYPGQGPSWNVSLGMEGRSFHSEGTNEYPKEQAEDQPQADPKAGPSVPFRVFWQAALTLVGKAEAPAPAK